MPENLRGQLVHGGIPAHHFKETVYVHHMALFAGNHLFQLFMASPSTTTGAWIRQTRSSANWLLTCCAAAVWLTRWGGWPLATTLRQENSIVRPLAVLPGACFTQLLPKLWMHVVVFPNSISTASATESIAFAALRFIGFTPLGSVCRMACIHCLAFVKSPNCQRKSSKFVFFTVHSSPPQPCP